MVTPPFPQQMKVLLALLMGPALFADALPGLAPIGATRPQVFPDPDPDAPWDHYAEMSIEESRRLRASDFKKDVVRPVMRKLASGDFLYGGYDSCSGRCNSNAGDCWCDSACRSYNDCCDDVTQYCGYTAYGTKTVTCVNDACGVCGGDGSTCAGCDGVSNSGTVVDACDVCGGDDSTCAGCDGVPNSGTVDDACGVCGGDGSTCTEPVIIQ